MAEHQVAAPASWRDGHDVIIGMAVSDEDAPTRFPGFTTVKLRVARAMCVRWRQGRQTWQAESIAG